MDYSVPSDFEREVVKLEARELRVAEESKQKPRYSLEKRRLPKHLKHTADADEKKTVKKE